MYEVETQGDLLKIKKASGRNQTQLEGVGERRGNILTFSRKSRKRLMENFARLDLSGEKVCFVTLTFHSIPDIDSARKAHRRFMERIRRAYPKVTGVWRKEFQKRGSVHYHMLLFNLPFIPQAELQDIWTECTGEDRSIVDIRMVKGKKHAWHYISKYIAKSDSGDALCSLDNVPYLHATGDTSIGRLWGWFRKSLCPWGYLMVVRVQSSGELWYLKWAMKVQTHFRTAKRTLSGSMFDDEAEKMFYHFLALVDAVEIETPDVYARVNLA